jgi:hypothetical protein
MCEVLLVLLRHSSPNCAYVHLPCCENFSRLFSLEGSFEARNNVKNF